MGNTELRNATRLQWRRLLISEYGIEGLLVLKENGPRIQPGDADSIIFQAGRVEGFTQALDALHNLIAAEKPKDIDYENR